MQGIKLTEKYTNVETQSLKNYLNDVSNIKMFTKEEEEACSIRAENGDLDAIEQLIVRNLRFVISVAKQFENENNDLEDLINEGNIGLIKAARLYKPSTGFKFITYAVFWIKKMILEYIGKSHKMIRLPANKVTGLTTMNKCIEKLEQKYEREVDASEIFEHYGDKFTEDEIIDLKKVSMMSINSFDRDSTMTDDMGGSLYDVTPDTSVKPTDYLVSDADLKIQVDFLLSKLKPKDKEIIKMIYGLGGYTPMSILDVSEKLGVTKETIRKTNERNLDKLREIYYR
jgi:RNA polymerase primary sigma factor